MLLDELDLSEEEGEEEEVANRREARQRLRKEAEVASCFIICPLTKCFFFSHCTVFSGLCSL